MIRPLVGMKMIIFITYQVYHTFICFQAKLNMSLTCVGDRYCKPDSPLTHTHRIE